MRLPQISQGTKRSVLGRPRNRGMGPSQNLSISDPREFLPIPTVPLYIASNCTLFTTMVCCPLHGQVICFPRS
jgi:hypothetical protein